MLVNFAHNLFIFNEWFMCVILISPSKKMSHVYESWKCSCFKQTFRTMKNSWPGDDVLKGTGINSETFLALTMSLEFILKILKYERSLFLEHKRKNGCQSFFAGHTANYFITVCLPTQQYQKQKQRGQSTWKKIDIIGK